MAYAPPQLIVPRMAPWPKEIPFVVRLTALIEAFITLLWLDWLGWLGFRKVHSTIATKRVSAQSAPYDALQLVRVAVRDAAIFYFKPVHCLQRSAAVTHMLRNRGLAATLVIGYLPMPVQGHAWVELNNEVVWDAHSRLKYSRVLDRI
jgi:hypothetical protein